MNEKKSNKNEILKDTPIKTEEAPKGNKVSKNVNKKTKEKKTTKLSKEKKDLKVKDIQNKKQNKKHAGGRPPKYSKKEELQKKIDNYFDSCFGIKTILDTKTKKEVIAKDINGNPIKVQTKPFTVTGLAMFLGMSRQDLINYSKKDEFFDTIKKAKMRIEEQLEEKLITNTGSTTGIIFNLKNNYGWNDRQENINIASSYEEYIKKVEEENEY